MLKERAVCEMGEWESNGNRENFRWLLMLRRELFVWELEFKQKLLREVSTIQWNKSMIDMWWWEGENLKLYTFQSGYKTLLEIHPSQQDEWFRDVWNRRVPSSIKIFGWRAMLDRLPTRMNIVRRGVNL